MANQIADIIVAGKLFSNAVAKRLRGAVELPPDLQNFTNALDDLFTGVDPELVAESVWVSLPANEPPWRNTEISLQVGDEVSYFLQGQVYANQFLDIWIGAASNIWCKIGDDGEVFRGTQNSHSFKAEHDGQLQLGNYFPNDWENPLGATKRSNDDYATVSGESKILVIKWKRSALKGLRALAKLGDYQGCFKNEIGRIEQGDTTPIGWRYLWNLGPADIYRDSKADNSQACIHCDTHKDVGILQYEIDLPLDASTSVSWRWLVDKLPSVLREDSLPSHDYLSLAVEFDNGRNLSYYWSASLPVAYGYDCPIPSWQGKEYHIVIRSGDAGLGEWQAEKRNVYEDYQRYIGEPPVKIVKVWLIANSIFQRHRGICTYSDISLLRGSETIPIL